MDSENTSFNMPVVPAYGSYGNGGGFGNFGGDGWWIIILLLVLCGGWGNGFGGGFGGGMMPFMMGAADGGFGLYPWLNNSQHISDGFRDQNLATAINGVQNSVTSGFGDVQTSLCSGFAGVNATVNSGVNTITSQLYANTIADLERSFASQTATTQGMNALQAQLAQCCCDNRAGLSDLKYTVATENCADRTAAAQNTQSILTALNAGVQSIKDQLCADKIEAKNDEISQLRQEVLYARGQASQVAQNSTIIDGIYNRLNQCPVGTVPVYGEQPIFTCPNNNNSCGCGCGNF